MRNQSPVHESALIVALVTDNHGNVGGSLGATLKRGVYFVDRGQDSIEPEYH
jgi:hypothetical protein